MVEISVLNDDRCTNEKCNNSHGLSLFVNVDGFKFLFDVGQDDNYIKNAKTLKIDLNEAKCLVLSHGHYDHTIGLKFLKNGTKIVCHPRCVVWRKKKSDGCYNGLPFKKDEFVSKFDVNFSKDPYFLTKDVVYLGEIERKFDFECKEFPSLFEDGTDDVAPDDSGVVINTKEGIVVISGCAHSGICNTIEYAKKVLKNENVLAVIGGFHLKKINSQVEETVKYFKKTQVKKLYLGHCTSDLVCQYFVEDLKTQFDVQILGAGLKISL